MAQLYLPFPHCHTGMAKNYAEYAFGLLVGQFVSDRYRLIQLKSPRFFTVDGKMMRRSGLLRRTGSTSTHGVVEVVKKKERKKRSNNVYAKFAARAPGIWQYRMIHRADMASEKC